VEVTLMKAASLLERGRDDQSGASRPTSTMPWRRRALTCYLEGQERMACSTVSGSKPQWGQEVLLSEDLQVGWEAR